MTIKRFKFMGSEFEVVSAICSKGPTSSSSAEYKLVCHRGGTNEYELMEITNAYEISPKGVEVCQPIWMEAVEAMVNRVLDRISMPNRGFDQVLNALLEYIEEAIQHEFASREPEEKRGRGLSLPGSKVALKSKIFDLLRHFQGEQ